jgi:cytochrome b pre-mRNA-processing protein 3
MFSFLTRPKSDPRPLFEAALAASRNPVLYSDIAVPDTFDGRFDCLLLHLWPVFKALEGQDKFSQQLYDLTFKRMELALRESGVGDLGVGKQVRFMMKAFYGRLTTFSGCQSHDEWRIALRRNLYGTVQTEGFEVPEGIIVYAKNLSTTQVLLDGKPYPQVIYPVL